MLIALFFIVFVLLSWVILKPEWMPAPPDNEITEKVITQAGILKEKSTDWFEKTKSFFNKKSSLGVQLKSWAQNEDLVTMANFTQTQAAMLEGFKTWLSSLSDVEADEISDELSEFCAKQGVDLHWILDDKGIGDMQSALSSLILFYVLAVKEREASRPAAALRAWQDEPFAKQNRAFGTRLYVLLVNAKLITIPADILLASEKVRLEHLVTAVKYLIEKDRTSILPYASLALEIKPTQITEKPKLNKKNKREANIVEQSA